ncbi:MAG: 30S ribosomal protein S1 [Acidobacteriota bacterium]|nr:30S ribosomal protein S1 [Acidobacteriota bacterium]
MPDGAYAVPDGANALPEEVPEDKTVGAVDSSVTTVDPEEYQHLLEDYSHLAPPSRHEVLDGRVLKISGSDVFIDVGYKSDGVAPLSQFTDASGAVTVQAGDIVEVMVESGHTSEGYVLLSHEKAARLKVWDHLENALQQQLTISGLVVGRIKGGLSVDVGVRAFMPGSQVDVRPVRNVEQFTGQTIPVKVVKLNRKRGNAVVSRKLAVLEEVEARKHVTLESLHEGAVLTGIVKNLTEYGAFVDLGGIDGLLHVTDLSYGRVTHPSEVLQLGEEVTVQVLKYDPAKERVSLGIRQLFPDPWEGVVERFPVNMRIVGRVVSVTDYGAFVEIATGVEGLIHISEMTWSRRMKHPSKLVKPGDQVESVVLEVNIKDRRISLGLKQLEANPWTTVEQRYSVGSVVEGRVRNMTEFGAFIEIEEGVDGLVHISDLSWTKRVKHPSEILRKGSMVQAVILAIDATHKRLSLGVKQLQPDAWETFFRQHHVNDTVQGKVLRLAGFGAFVEICEGVEGLCHFSEVPGWSSRKSDTAPLSPGQEMNFKIVKMNEAERKIGLSLKAFAEAEEHGRMNEYRKRAAAASASLEDYLPRRDPR